LLDLLTTQGVQLLWPLQTWYTYGLFNSLETTPNLILIIVSIVIIWNNDILRDKLLRIDYKTVQKITFSLLLIPILLVIPLHYLNVSNCESVSINDLLNNVEVYDEACVSTRGIICSQIEEYVASSGNTYEIFTLCNESNITVWLLKNLSPGIEYNDSVLITALFTTRYYETSGYELYMIKDISFQ
jgi:hypothetical protein